MSHFTVLIIGQNPEEQLRPFDENLDVPRYVKYTKEELIKKGRADIEKYRVGTYARYMDDPTEYSKGSNVAHINYVANEFPLKLTWTDEQVYQDSIKYYNQSDIGANGEVYSDRNPKSKWDWYQLGGRWAGSLQIKEGVKFEEPNFSWGWNQSEISEVLSQRKSDSALKKDIANIDTLVTFAVIKDGQWYERGEMGWWGVVSDEKDESEWDNQFHELLKSVPDDTLLSVYDCHI